MNRYIGIVVIIAIAAAIMAGCGGSSNHQEAGVISGTVKDIAGNMIPGAAVEVLDTGGSSRSLMNGTYKVGGVPEDIGWVTLKASATIDGRNWVGYRAAQIFSDGPAQTQDIVIAPIGDTGTIRGTVRDQSGYGIDGARVFATATFPGAPAGEEVSSQVTMTAVADSNGSYEFTNVPAVIDTNSGTETLHYTVTASSVGRSGQQGGFANQSKNTDVTPGGEVSLNFVLTPSSTDTLSDPTDSYGNAWTDSNALVALSYTLPSNVVSREVSAYKAVMATASPKLREALSKSNGVTRATPSGSIIEIDLLWYWFDWNAVNTNMAGFGIYRKEGSSPRVSDQDQIDFVRDPKLTMYGDTSNTLTPGHEYFYGVTGVSTSYLDAQDQFNPASESDISGIARVTPLDQLEETSPSMNASVSGSSITFRWKPLPGAANYRLIIYHSYPVVENYTTYPGSANRPIYLPDYDKYDSNGASSVTVQDLAPGTYYWTVLAADDNNVDTATAYSIGELRILRVPS